MMVIDDISEENLVVAFARTLERLAKSGKLVCGHSNLTCQCRLLTYERLNVESILFQCDCIGGFTQTFEDECEKIKEDKV